MLAQHEVGENDEVSLKAIQDMQSNIVKMSNNATSMIAGFENELDQLEVECGKNQERELTLTPFFYISNNEFRMIIKNHSKNI